MTTPRQLQSVPMFKDFSLPFALPGVLLIERFSGRSAELLEIEKVLEDEGRANSCGLRFGRNGQDIACDQVCNPALQRLFYHSFGSMGWMRHR